MATFWEIAARSINNFLSICNIYLFPVFGFTSGICLLIAPVPVHCFNFLLLFFKITRKRNNKNEIAWNLNELFSYYICQLSTF